jgi:hypothetical protein
MFETMQSELSFHNSKLWAWKVRVDMHALFIIDWLTNFVLGI